MNQRQIRFATIVVLLSLQAFSRDSWAGGFAEQLARKSVQRQLQAADQSFRLQQGFLNLLRSLPLNAMIALPDATLQTAGTFEQRINPEDPSDTRTFKQRYYTNSTYALGPNSPVLFYICGEATCEARSLLGAIETHAKAQHAHLVALEHRFYGKSQPFAALTSENLAYLRTEFALADLASFQAYAQAQWGWTGKWISVGGSYPGSLSAYYRLKYPNLVAGALASSAPVQAQENFEEYDWVVADRVGAPCAQAMRTVVSRIEATLDHPAELAAVKKLFLAEDIADPVDFIYVVADMGAIAVQYGMKEKFCQTLTNAADPLIGYAEAGLAAFDAFGMKPIEDSFQAAMSTNPDDYLASFGLRQWMYQSCTEYGYFQNAFHDPAQSVRSQRINPEFHRRICHEIFGTPALDTRPINEHLYAPLLQASTTRILLTNGGNDPWATLSISEALGNASNPNLTTLTIQGAAHCDDLRAPKVLDSESIKGARGVFSGLMEQWLR